MRKNVHSCILKDKDPHIDFAKWQTLVNMISEMYETAAGVIVQLRDNEFNVVSASQNDDNFLSVNVAWSWDVPSFCRQVAETGEFIYENEPANSPAWANSPAVCNGPVRSYLGYPVFWPDGSLFGTICSIDTKATNYSNSYVKLLSQLAELIESELQHVADYEQIRDLLQETEKQQRQLTYMAMYDSLTGCANRHLLSDRFETNIARSNRSQSGFSLLYLDLNKFKPVNDTYGHKVGDHVLATTAKRLQSTLRKTDLAARIGGDEFVVLFESEVDCTQLIEKVSQAIEQPISIDGHEITISASFGYSSYPADGQNMDKLLEAADKHMYSNKTTCES